MIIPRIVDSPASDDISTIHFMACENYLLLVLSRTIFRVLLRSTTICMSFYRYVCLTGLAKSSIVTTIIVLPLYPTGILT